jgi:TetR/AcrR family transcriptional repressor of bet genes
VARTRTSDGRRQQIVNALHSVLGKRGYDGASVQILAEHAGLTPGLVHYHFASKEQILLALVEQLREQLAARVARRDGDAPPDGIARAWHRLDAWIDGHLALGDDADPASVAAWVAIGAEALRKPEVQRAYAAAVADDLAQARARIGDVLGAQGRPLAEAESFSVALLAAIEGCYRLAAGAPSVTPPGFAAPTVRALARGLLEAAP